MPDLRVEVIKLGIDFDLQAEIEARAKKPVELTDSGAEELDKAIVLKQKDDAKRAVAESKAKAKEDAEAAEIARCEKALVLLQENSAQNKASSSSDLLSAAGLTDAEFKPLMARMKRLLKEKGFDVQKSTRKGVVYYTLVKF